MANNRYSVWAAPTVGGTPDIWGPWQRADTFIITTPDTTANVELDFESTTDSA